MFVIELLDGDTVLFRVHEKSVQSAIEYLTKLLNKLPAGKWPKGGSIRIVPELTKS